ncbi:DUF480 domain-containing protein [Nostocoides sp. F2B08]|uniref:DUF480 domain-containing protein n=1 Tax=Nostocoides sp. F2B08 TaxID=2653936 RepID=UPI001263959A|nr:DUF480 domain-containing protein [Tetrasphaera sp. F2B08]KAB7745452.1 DUF480 domain-containing protein [Tetrasphaera sp. F2B08]
MSPLPHLEPTEQRVLGALLEKQVTVPAGYPLTVNALRTACNQSTSRDPVVDYDDQTVESTARALKGRGLVRVVWDGRGQRTLKFHQLLDETLGLDPAERALITVLLLRGPQSAGELRTRTERLHGFTDRAAVEECLSRLATREEPLVQELARRPGWQDPRWIHLLGPVQLPSDAHVASESVDLESVLTEGPQARDAKVSAAYDSLAGEYATRLASELDEAPFERWLLERVVDLADGHPVADVGCGPGLISAYLHDHGARVVASDLSAEMIAQARVDHPEITFEVGDLRRLMRPVDADGWGVVLAWYSLVHLAGSELRDAIEALARPVRPGGSVVLSLYAGPSIRHVAELWDIPVDLDFVHHDPATVIAAAEAVGLTDVEWYERGTSPGADEPVHRFYLIGRRGS